MKYTLKTAAMTLATARDVLATPGKRWSADQIARARCVVAHWERVRRAQTAKRIS